MLTKRTNILFNDAIWQKLVSKSEAEAVSVGELVRKAVEKVYNLDKISNRLPKTVETILSKRKKYSHINYKDLINYGRSNDFVPAERDTIIDSR